MSELKTTIKIASIPIEIIEPIEERWEADKLLIELDTDTDIVTFSISSGDEIFRAKWVNNLENLFDNALNEFSK